MTLKSNEQLRQMALARARSILDTWWEETPDIWEYQEEHNLCDKELEFLLATKIYVTTEPNIVHVEPE